MNTETTTSTTTTTTAAPTVGDASGTPAAAIPPRGGLTPPAGPATVTVAYRRASDIREGDVIALPDEVFVPVPARLGGRRTWVWQSKPSRLLPNAHQWRWVYDAGQLDGDDAGFAASLPAGFRLLRVSDDQPDQGTRYTDLIIAVRELDLAAIQIHRTETTPHHPEDAPTLVGGDVAGDSKAAIPDHTPPCTTR